MKQKKAANKKQKAKAKSRARQRKKQLQKAEEQGKTQPVSITRIIHVSHSRKRHHKSDKCKVLDCPQGNPHIFRHSPPQDLHRAYQPVFESLRPTSMLPSEINWARRPGEGSAHGWQHTRPASGRSQKWRRGSASNTGLNPLLLLASLLFRTSDTPIDTPK